MMNYTNGLILCFILIITIQLGKSLKCYKCSSQIDSLCKDPFYENFPKVECAEDNVCVKLVTPATDFVVHTTPKLVYSRNCMAGNFCSEVTSEQSNTHHCSQCTTNFCNSHSTIRPSVILLYVMVLMYIFKVIL